MRYSLLLIVMLLSLAATNALAADKNKLNAQIDAATAKLEAFVIKTGKIRDGAKDLNQVRLYIKRATEAYEKGGQLFGLAGIKPEAEQEINHYLMLAELSLEVASNRIDRSKAALELEGLEKTLAEIQVKIKVFEDRKAEIAKLKVDAAKYQAAAQEIESLKGDNVRLISETERLKVELKKLSDQLAEAKKAAALPKVEPKVAADPPKEEPADKK